MSWFVRDQICAGKPAKTHTWKALKLRIFCIFLKSFHQLIDLFHRRCSHILQPAVKKADWKPENINKRGQNLAYTWHIRVTAVWLWFVALSWALLCEWSCASPFPHTLPENKSVHHVYPPQPPDSIGFISPWILSSQADRHTDSSWASWSARARQK